MAVTVRESDGTELEELLNKKTGKVLVDFYSSTCGPCKMLGYVLNDVAKDVHDIEILKLDFDLNQEVVKKYGVEGYPTLILFNQGQETQRLKGLQQKPLLINMINS
ncbi:thioredoxin 1 [Desulfitobacterium sp. LBE]|uniref:thioredoxin family protein n=1 Tax=Desulfitobacterium sp. LBE TaxID=884086 RepID=UPI00119A1EF4|nr:thioredoxin domain-containing protein [Desulfitobacterium sp. LBE]TWH59199.1 thioredoxin 1 [Desulfitobacterium sp. LBE]